MQGTATKIWTALVARPTNRDIARIFHETVWLAPILGVCVILSDSMQWAPNFDASTLRLAVVAVLVPSLGEELLFRVALLPKPEPDAPLSTAHSAAVLALFVLWHPLQAFFTSDARATTFLDPWFLVAVAALGLACTRLYWRSRSIWPPVAMHWIVVVAWKSLAGGPALV